MGKLWTEEEVKLLDTFLTNEEIAQKIGRTALAVKQKRYRTEHPHGTYEEGIRIMPSQVTTKEFRIAKIIERAKKLGVKLLGR